MERLFDADIDPGPLVGKRIAIIGYGNQGRAQARNLLDGAMDVVVGLRSGSPRADLASADGLPTTTPVEAVAGADLVMLLIPDEAMKSVYLTIDGAIKAGAALGFSHGLAIHFGFVTPRRDLDVFLVAPKGPGTALRSLYQAGKGMLALWAVAQDASGQAREVALAYGRAIGCARVGLIESSFAEECEADLFNEGAVVWGGVPELLIAGFDTLVEAGVRPEVAYLECVSELKLLADLIEARGIAGMREAISNTAELGAVLGGSEVVDQRVRQRMRDILTGIREGRFAQVLEEEETAGHPRLKEARRIARSLPVETARRSLEQN